MPVLAAEVVAVVIRAASLPSLFKTREHGAVQKRPFNSTNNSGGTLIDYRLEESCVEGIRLKKLAIKGVRVHVTDDDEIVAALGLSEFAQIRQQPANAIYPAAPIGMIHPVRKIGADDNELGIAAVHVTERITRLAGRDSNIDPTPFNKTHFVTSPVVANQPIPILLCSLQFAKAQEGQGGREGRPAPEPRRPHVRGRRPQQALGR